MDTDDEFCVQLKLIEPEISGVLAEKFHPPNKK
jgi:hypothetical protein